MSQEIKAVIEEVKVQAFIEDVKIEASIEEIKIEAPIEEIQINAEIVQENIEATVEGTVLQMDGLVDADYGDVTVSNNGSTITIDNNAVTTSKIANNNVTLGKLDTIAPNHFLGRHTPGNGNVQQVSASQARNILNVENGAEVNTVDSVNGKTGVVVINKTDIGLSNVDNTSDLNKPISNATQTALADRLFKGGDVMSGSLGMGNNIIFNVATPINNDHATNKSYVDTALNAKENTITAGTVSQYYRGDKTFQTLDKTAVGLGSVDNTTDLNKPISTPTQTALNAKQDTLVSGTNIKTINTQSILGAGNLTITATAAETFETVSKNLKTYPASLNYTLGVLTSIVYTLPVGTITKTLNYTLGTLTSIVLSGDTPAGIDLTKTLGYTGSELTSITYS